MYTKRGMIFKAPWYNKGIGEKKEIITKRGM